MSIVKLAILAAALGIAAPAFAKVQPFTTGWDNFNEPIDLANSSVKWSVSPKTKSLTVTYTLAGANPTKLYQVAVAIFCQTAPANFGRYPIESSTCSAITRQGKTASDTGAELGVILTDSSGAGAVTISTGALPAGKYTVEFTVRDGAGCAVTGGGSDCNVDFQSPGPFDTGLDTFTVK